MESMFTGLISLRYLILNRCSLPKKLYFGLLPLLKYLVIVVCFGIERIEFSTANLLNFSCFCRQKVVCDLSGVSNLEKFQYFASTRQMQYVFTCMPEHSPKLKTLNFKISSNWALCIPESITIFGGVTSLDIIFNCHGSFDILKMISILGAFPSLQKLVLKSCFSEDVKREKLVDGECAHKHLKDRT